MGKPLLAALALASLGLAAAQTDVLSKLSPAERDLLLAAGNIGGLNGFLPGVVGPDLPFEVAPLAGRAVVGTVRQFDGAVVVVRTTLDADTAQRVAEGLLRKNGWQDAYPRGGGEREVFQSGSSIGRSFYPLCKKGVPGQLTVTSFDQVGGAQLAYRLNAFSGISSSCPAFSSNNDPKQANYYAPQNDSTYVDPLQKQIDAGLKLPKLVAPPQASVELSGSMYSDTEYSTYVTLYSPQSAEAVRASYAAALRAQGWAPVGSTTVLNGQERISRYTFRQGTREREGSLSLMPRPDLGRTEGSQKLNRYDVRLKLSF